MINVSMQPWRHSFTYKCISQVCKELLLPEILSLPFRLSPQNSNLFSKLILCHKMSRTDLVVSFFSVCVWFYLALNTHLGGFGALQVFNVIIIIIKQSIINLLICTSIPHKPSIIGIHGIQNHLQFTSHR